MTRLARRDIQVNLTEGKNSLEKNEYAVALARFRLVERDAPKLPGSRRAHRRCDRETGRQRSTRRSTAVKRNEAANKLMDARRWYDQALQHNPQLGGRPREARRASLSR